MNRVEQTFATKEKDDHFSQKMLSEPMSQPLLLFLILVEGFITISAEILTIRQLLPVAGNSVVITSLIIGVFLLFLAYGYRRGGQIQDNFEEILKINFSKAAFIFGVGLSINFILWFFQCFYSIFHAQIFLTVSLYLLVITAPLVYILGQTVPITMNLVKKPKNSENKSVQVGAIGGKILHLSTLGSFLGAVLTSLLLMNFLGVAWSVVINCILLSILALFFFKKTLYDFSLLILLITSLMVSYILNVMHENKTVLHSNAVNSYDVKQMNDGKLLVVNFSPFSYLGPNKEGFEYIETIKRILFQDLKYKDKDILVLGAGGFTLTSNGDHGNRVTYVDLDKDIKTVVQNHFQKNINGEFFGEDARVFLNNSKKLYDVIISDVYSSAQSIPAHLITQEYFQAVWNKLKNKGLAIVLIMGKPMLDDPYTGTVDNTIRSVFPHCSIIPNRYSQDGSAQILFVCHKEDQHAGQNNSPSNNSTINNSVINNSIYPIYKDNLNRATFDFFRSMYKFAFHRGA